LARKIARGQIARGDVRLYQFAAPDKMRPALVLTRNSAIAYLSSVTVAPITSTIRGMPSEVVLNEEDGMKFPCAVNLHTMRLRCRNSAWGSGSISLVPHE
jgi:mRNA-degrading endonuclease toxin of MazEF toxin-antitoxin module